MYATLRETTEKTFDRAIAAGVISVAEAEELRLRFSYLAFNIVDCGADSIERLPFAGWLFHIREQGNPGLPHTEPKASPDERLQARYLMDAAFAIGLLKRKEDGWTFAQDGALFYFCLLYCRSLPIDATTLERVYWYDFASVWRLWTEAAPQLSESLVTLLREQKDSSAGLDAARTLGIIGNEAVIAQLFTALNDPDPKIRRLIVLAFSYIDDEGAIKTLITALKDPDEDVRREAAYALRNCGNNGAIQPLIAVLDDKNAHVRKWATVGLSALKADIAVEPLITLLRDNVSQVREYSAEALGHIGNVRALTPLFETLHDVDPEVRTAAVKALAEIGDAQAIPQLRPLRADTDKTVQIWATCALGMLGDIRVSDSLLAMLSAPLPEHQKWVHGRVAEALGRLGDKRAFDTLSTALSTAHWNTRRFIVLALGRLGDERAIHMLIAVSQQDTNKYVRAAATIALGELDATHALPALSQFQDNKESMDAR